jgi:hypothetical protein
MLAGIRIFIGLVFTVHGEERLREREHAIRAARIMTRNDPGPRTA